LSRILRVYILAGIVACAVVASHLLALGTAPPGLFNDEAGFGYNGWTISHFGTDQYGTPWPLFFRSGGDYKGPAGVYFEALLTSFLPLTPWVIRLPNAIGGIALAFAAGWLGWRLTRSHAVALILVLEAAFEPWFFHLGRTMLEADLLTPLCYVVPLAALAAGGERRLRNCLAAGVVLGAACFTAQPARFFTLAVLVIVVFAFRRTLSGARLAALAVPVVLALALIVTAGSEATARLGAVSVFNRGLVGGALQAFSDYFGYQGPVLLFIHGDSNLRHSSGFEGLLFVTAAVPLVLGAVAAFKRRSEPLATIALLGTLIAPAAATLAVGVSARRDVVVLPFLLVLLAFGWQALIPWLLVRRARMAVAVVCVLVAAVPYYVDYAFAYPARAARSFDTGGIDAITRAHALAQGHSILISHNLGSEDALVALKPDPRIAGSLGSMGVRVASSPSDIETAPAGDLLVLTSRDVPPDGAVLLFQDVAISVYRR
jgi:4-amino-4-deoxy-L-arabinose transferase-like glycosyltransferase